MPDKIFVDTNVLLYLLSNVSLKKFQLSLDDTREILKKISEKTIVFAFNENTIIYALEIKNIYKYQFYDCLIIATALENHCTILYSEDMQHNLLIENQLRIINPFIK